MIMLYVAEKCQNIYVIKSEFPLFVFSIVLDSMRYIIQYQEFHSKHD